MSTGRIRTVALCALAIVVGPAAPARAAGRPPILESFTARYDATTTTTTYTAVAKDPDGGALRFAWSLRADCGFLVSPRGAGPTNGYQHGPPARGPSGCPLATSRAAALTVTIADSEGCSIVYSQPARDETTHAQPRTTARPCPPLAGASGSGVPAGLILLLIVVVVLLAALGVLRARARGETGGRSHRERPRRKRLGREDRIGGATAAPEEEAPTAVCEEGAVRNEATRVLAHETVAAGAVVLVVLTTGGLRREIELHLSFPSVSEILARLGSDVAEVDASIPLRIATVRCRTREVCRDGDWRVEGAFEGDDGPLRTERLRARSAAPEGVERFIAEVLAARGRSLEDARRRLDAAESRCLDIEGRLS